MNRLLCAKRVCFISSGQRFKQFKRTHLWFGYGWRINFHFHWSFRSVLFDLIVFGLAFYRSADVWLIIGLVRFCGAFNSSGCFLNLFEYFLNLRLDFPFFSSNRDFILYLNFDRLLLNFNWNINSFSLFNNLNFRKNNFFLLLLDFLFLLNLYLS